MSTVSPQGPSASSAPPSTELTDAHAHPSAARRAWVLAAGLVALSGSTAWLRHRMQAGRSSDSPQLGQNIPLVFGAWSLSNSAGPLVNPQTQQQLDRLYSEVVTRTYVGKGSYAVMLSVAYGHDQRGGLETHRPEVCYPAQGFTLHDQRDDDLQTVHGTIPVRRLQTSMAARVEPVTYWFAMANALNASAFEKRLIRLRTALTGSIPDGILLRVSSIDSNAARAYATHDDFIRDLLANLPSATRSRLLGHA